MGPELALLVLLSAFSFFGGGRTHSRRFPAPLLLVLSAVIIFSLDGWLAFRQYQVWSMGGLTRFLLPDYHPGSNYFLFYSLTRIFAPHLISLGLAIVFLLVLRGINNKHNRQFFEDEEPYLAATSLFLSGHPGWIFYLVFLVGFYLLWHLLSRLGRRGRSERLPLYHLWANAGVVTVLMAHFWLSHTSFWSLLKI